MAFNMKAAIAAAKGKVDMTQTSGGDDYELCFTISPQNYEKLLQQQLDVNISKIGQIDQKTELTFVQNGVDHSLQFHGYEHFA